MNALSSSGIGLSLARSLSELHHGSLILEERDGMNCFVLRLPVAQNVEKSDTLSLNEDFLPEDSVIDDEKQDTEVVLIVEDNVELLHFMVDKLKQQFIVEQAQNGVEALKILEEKNIDIASDKICLCRMKASVYGKDGLVEASADTLKLFAETAPVRWTQIDGYFRGIYNDGSGVFDLYNVRYQIPE